MAEIQLEQADGSSLLLQQPAERLVTLSPHLTELVFAAGAGQQIVATVEYSEYPDAAALIPRVGDAFRLDIERIVSLKPDLVIAWDSGNPKPAISQLRSLGITVWSVEIREPGDIANILKSTGLATGSPEQANLEANRIEQGLANISEQYRGASAVSYFYQVAARPLFTINGDHLISKGLEFCGGKNVFGPEQGLAFQVGHESVIVANPEALFAPYSEDDPDPLSTWKDWPAMRAVNNHALYLLPADPISQATPRFVDTLAQACKLLHRLREPSINE